MTARLHEIHRGVYLVGHSVPTEHARDMAALLAFRDDGVLSHRSAASHWDLLSYPASAPACVTVPPGRSAKRPNIVIHRVMPVTGRQISNEGEGVIERLRRAGVPS